MVLQDRWRYMVCHKSGLSRNSSVLCVGEVILRFRVDVSGSPFIICPEKYQSQSHYKLDRIVLNFW